MLNYDSFQNGNHNPNEAGLERCNRRGKCNIRVHPFVTPLLESTTAETN